MSLPRLNAIADIRFGDQVVWQCVDGPEAGLVVGFAADVSENIGCMIPYMLVKAADLPTPIKMCLSVPYLELMQLEIVGFAA